LQLSVDLEELSSRERAAARADEENRRRRLKPDVRADPIEVRHQLGARRGGAGRVREALEREDDGVRGGALRVEEGAEVVENRLQERGKECACEQ
jgi:hypothetical protein